MATWYKAKWIISFFAALDKRFPNRDRGTDGTIGDLEHATGVSGHNPDDTPGVKAERQDPDTKPEVRAADAGTTLRDPDGYTMWDVVNAILASPEELKRLIYIIFDGCIWRAATGWKREPYEGKDKHRTHAHLSGNPEADEDGGPWNSIINIGRAPGDEDGMSEFIGPIDIPEAGSHASLSLEEVGGGAWPREAFLNITNDTYDKPYALRVAIGNGMGGWDVKKITVASGFQYVIPLPKGTRVLGISRYGLDGAGKPVEPGSTEMVTAPYEGPLTVSIARGPVKA